jgi:O-antigen/teichoic acid export membrane protein
MTVDTLGLRVRVAQPINKALRNEFLRHSALVFGATAASNFFNYVFNFALSRRLGVEGFATLASLVSFIMILSIPASVLTMIIVKYAATFHAAGDSQRVRRLSQLLLKWSSIVAAAAFALGVLLENDIAVFLHIRADASIPLCIAVLALSFVTPSVRGILQGEQDFVRYSVSLVLETFLKVLIAVGFVYSGFGVTGAMFGWAVGTLTALVYTVWAVLRRHGASADSSVTLALNVRQLVKTTAGVGIANALLITMSFMDVLLVKHYFDAYQAGLYAALNLTGKIVLFVGSFVPAVLLPKAVAKATRQQKATPLLLQALAVTTVLSGATLTFFALEPAMIIRVLAGQAFTSAAPYVLQYDAAMGLLAFLALLVNYRIAIHRFEFLYPLSVVLACEIAAIALFHTQVWDIVHVLLIGNMFGIAACAVPWKATRITVEAHTT